MDRRKFKGKISRRELLKGTGAGLCTLCLSSLTGCMPGEDAGEETENLQDQTHKGEPATEITQKKGLVNPKPSPWFKEADQGKVKCVLCPKACTLEDGERALCRVRENQQGEGITLAYGNPALLQEDPIERKPFYHVFPGIRALSVSTAGCNLSCKFCEVWDMALEDPEKVYAHDAPPEKVIQYAQQGGVQAISYAFGEPVIFYEYMEDIANKAKAAGLLNLVHTAGYIQREPLKNLMDKVDAFNIDLKSFDPDFYRDIVGGELDPVLETIKMLREAQVHIELTNPVIPTLNDDTDTLKAMCEWIADQLGRDVPLHFARFYPLYKLSDLPRTPVSTLDKARDIALDAGLNYVYVAKVTDHEGENTYCPDCGEILIDRMGFVIEENHIKDGKCKYCDYPVPGKWA